MSEASDRAAIRELVLSGALAAEPRPRDMRRGDCAGGARPCALVSCRHHLLLEIRPTGSLIRGRANAGPAAPGPPVLQLVATAADADAWIDEAVAHLEAMPHTCALDVADEGGKTLAEVAEIWGLVRERVRQIEEVALRKLRRSVSDE